MNIQTIDEKVNVNLLNNTPISIEWKNRNYNVTKIGLHYKYTEGKNLIHIFTVLSDDLFFKLKLNTNNLSWIVEETMINGI